MESCLGSPFGMDPHGKRGLGWSPQNLNSFVCLIANVASNFIISPDKGEGIHLISPRPEFPVVADQVCNL